MDLSTLIKSSFKILKANRSRTFLTTLNIVIGIAAVIIIMSVGAGAQNLILNQITSAGSNLIGILPGYSDEKGPPASAFGIISTTLKQSDAEAVEKIKEIKAASGYVRGVGTLQYQNQKADVSFVGTTSKYIDIESTHTKLGTFFNKNNDKGISQVIVLGWQVYQDLFDSQNPIGQRVKIKNKNFRVIGVMKKRGVQSFENQDTLVFIPLETAQKILLGINYVNIIRAKVANDKDIPIALKKIKDTLRERHLIQPGQKDDFSAHAATQALNSLKQITNALKFFLTSIAAISLIVGGVGIMNIMLVSINERTREIGLRKAIGATPQNIQTQFLVESLTITILGGLIGILIGSLISALVVVIAKYLGYHWTFIITISSILVSVSISASAGILFGWYPARKASKLEPVDALRYE